MRICVLWTLILLLVFPSVSYTKEIHVHGVVFQDINQNGIRDKEEFGIGGVRLKANDQSFYTGEDGKYSQTIDLEDEFGSVTIDEEMLPAGSQLTTAPSIIINKNNSNYSNNAFGITFKTDTFDYPKFNEEHEQVLIKRGFLFEVKNHKLYLNKVPVINFPSSLEESGVESVKLPLNESGELISQSELESFLKGIKPKRDSNEITDLSIEVSMPLNDIEDTQKLDRIAGDFEKVIAQSLTYNKINRKLGYKDSSLEVTVRLGKRTPNKCRIYHGPTTYEIDDRKSYVVEAGDKDKLTFQADCPGKISKIEVRILGENFLAKVDKKNFGGKTEISKEIISISTPSSVESGLSIEQNVHLEKNRDKFAQFLIKSKNLKTYSINGREYKGSDTQQTYLHKGTPGRNVLKLSMMDKQGNERFAKHVFNLYQQRKFYFSATLDSYDLRSRSSKFDFNYDIPTERRVNLQTLFFFDQKWGAHFGHIRDIQQQSTELAAEGSASYKRTESQVHGVYRFKVFNSDHFAPVLHLFAGLQIKEANLPNDSLLHFPKPFKGLSVGGELLKENFFTTQVASSTSLFMGYADSENHTLRFSQEFRINLNHIGKVFSAKKENIYGPTYRGWNNVRLVIGMNYETDEREAENVSAMISDKTIAYRVGLAIQM